MLKIITVLLCCINLSFAPMSMTYLIEPNIKTLCKNEFPEGLSYFFEQFGGYADKSIVSQVEKVLDIDLKTFQEYDFPENDNPSKKYWKEIKEFESVINLFINKIKSNPDYYKRIKYNPIKVVYGFSTDSLETKRINQTQKENQSHPMFGYPNDDDYLSSKAILKDLENLKALLNCYKKSGATKIKLTYM